VQVSRCSPLGNRSPDHRHPGSLTRCAALLSSTLQAFARLCKCRLRFACGVPLWRQTEACATCTPLSNPQVRCPFRWAESRSPARSGVPWVVGPGKVRRGARG
jgi:hypothetical protein